MKVAVIGAGIIGVTTAYELAADGHEVTVFERRGSVAEETSFANAGVVAPGYVTPWAAPGMRSKVLKYLFAAHAPVRVRWPLTTHELKWMLQWSSSCKPELFARNRTQLSQLAFYSRERLHELTEQLGLEYDRASGYTVLLRGEKEHQIMQPGLGVLRELGVKYWELDEAGTRAIEPALNPDTRFAGSIHLPDDEVANCRQFAQLLRDKARDRGVNFELKARVVSVSIETDARLSVAFESQADELNAASIQRPTWQNGFSNGLTEPAPIEDLGATTPKRLPMSQTARFDHVVMCAGADSAQLLKPLGIQVPLAKIWGYSVSAHIREPLNAPRSALMDERYKVAISRLGNRVRVAGSADIGGRPGTIPPSALATLYKVLSDWFPGAAHMRHVQEWKGARPMLPDGPPLIGPTPVKNLWLNLGHGSSGWALACGSARVVADQISSRKPTIDVSGLDLSRFSR